MTRDNLTTPEQAVLEEPWGFEEQQGAFEGVGALLVGLGEFAGGVSLDLGDAQRGFEIADAVMLSRATMTKYHRELRS